MVADAANKKPGNPGSLGTEVQSEKWDYEEPGLIINPRYERYEQHILGFCLQRPYSSVKSPQQLLSKFTPKSG